MKKLKLITSLLGLAATMSVSSGQDDRGADVELLPKVPEGFEVSFFAREPLVRQPCSMAFDAKGRLCVGMGPQYRSPKPDTPGDSVVFVLDHDGDGQADETKVFAKGFNCIQGLAWHGDELWIANAPDLTVVRDLDGDDVADEYVRLYTDLGNLEHGLHGLTWGPDGRLYMSKGNSKGLNQPGRYAPKAFRELWGMSAPPDTPDFPEPVRFTAETYQKNYHNPKDDWGRDGGVLRCDADGGKLEIISQGARNPWDIAMDDSFNWLGSDNDQSKGDQIFMPFLGAHFGWNHMWSSHWGTEPHAPTAPVSGPLYEGSGTGIIYGNSAAFPDSHREVFFINDWLNKTTFVWRPRWDGALLRAENGLEPFIVGDRSLFRPTDIETGPDGALWVLGWGSGYGAEYKDGEVTNEGRVFRISYQGRTLADTNAQLRETPYSDWPLDGLLHDLESHLPVRRTDAQEELVRRGGAVVPQLLRRLKGDVSVRLETWLVWTLARIAVNDESIDRNLATLFSESGDSLNRRIQSLRALADRDGWSGRKASTEPIRIALLASDPRLRFEGILAIRRAEPAAARKFLETVLAEEKDATVYYAGWQALRHLIPQAAQKELLTDARPAVQRAALLALMEDNALDLSEIAPFAQDPSRSLREIAQLRLSKGVGGESAMIKGRPLSEGTPDSADRKTRLEDLTITLVSELRVQKDRDYRFASNLRPGVRPYTDRNFRIEKVPDSLQGATFLQTQNRDDKVSGDDWLSFTAHRPVRVIMALDHRLSAPPEWVRDHFTPMDEVIRADHWIFRLHSAEFPAGQITLGGNTDDGQAGGKGMYIAVVQPLEIQPPSQPTSVEAVLKLGGSGNPDSGRWLFHAANGVGCYACHRLENHGNAFGPDLATLSKRSTAQHTIQSILEPSAVITEGYNQVNIETNEESLSGILIEESGLSVSLGLADGTRRTIPKSRITSRSTSDHSSMPSYAALLKAQEAADLVAYLMESSDAVTAESAAKGVKDSTIGFAVAAKDDRLSLTLRGNPLADYVFSDPEIRRPYFANVHATNGKKVTRNFPPIEGVDAMDHSSMHPGLWLAFGDLNEHDFWRHKASVKHVRFIDSPAVKDDTLSFSVENHWIGTDGSLVCRETARYSFSEIEQEDGVRGTALIWEASFLSDEQDLRFGHQEEMGLGIRMATGLTVKTGTGTILNSQGHRNGKQVWGNNAEWWDYGGRLDNEFVGILVVPDGKVTPTSWGHARDYGALVVNPTRRPRANGTFIGVKSGVPLKLRYGLMFYTAQDDSSTDKRVNAMAKLLAQPKE